MLKPVLVVPTRAWSQRPSHSDADVWKASVPLKLSAGSPIERIPGPTSKTMVGAELLESRTMALLPSVNVVRKATFSPPSTGNREPAMDWRPSPGREATMRRSVGASRVPE